ncbi:DUF3718 domain-containing protein [Alteromonas sp. ASW11-36]|uniref:DUF3718 domain-containing protein n=1 Tax=Alteromonas arenosi TaxID=3055817 RepID=A0ABT7STU4_9ALTE|nr:DUF3718 domain-containing protein [Alteromonas sp. ASW11-36]MDM7859596.1 DUF3718 domain-containing protein [Alteromonas sp. ASW11-36]
MKTLTTIAKVAALSVGLGVTGLAQAELETAQLENVKFTGDVRYAGYCKAILENNVSAIRQFANRSVGEVAGSRRGVIRLVSSENGVTCNGKNLVEFSLEKNATDVHAFLVAQR